MPGAIVFLILLTLTFLAAHARGEYTGCLSAIMNSVGTIIIVIVVVWIFYEIIVISGDNLFLRLILLASVTFLSYWLLNKFK